MTKVRVETNGAVRNIVLNRPEKLNALDAEMLSLLGDAFAIDPEESERVVAIRAEGPAFSTGLDLREERKAGVGSSGIESVLEAVAKFPLPVVAVVHGDAIAGGNELALHCDLVVASTNASFGMSMAQLGLAPSWFLAKRILETAGPAAAREILLLGEPVPALRMHQMGIVCRVVPKHRLDSTAQAVLDRLASNAPLALRAMKELLTRQMALRDAIEHEDLDAIVEGVLASEDAREGITAFLERRPARFNSK